MSKITVCIFGAEGKTRTEILAAMIDKLQISSVTGRFSSNKPNLQEVEKETGQIRLFFDPPQGERWVETNERGELKAEYVHLSDIPSIKKGLEEIKERIDRILNSGRFYSQKENESNKPQKWQPHKGERVACYQDGDSVYKVLPYHTATNGNFCPTEKYYDHIKRYSGQESMRISVLRDEPEL